MPLRHPASNTISNSLRTRRIGRQFRSAARLQIQVTQEIRSDVGSFGYQAHPDRDTRGNSRLSPNLALLGQAWLDGTPAIVTKGRFRSHHHPRVRDRRGWVVFATPGTHFQGAATFVNLFAR